MKLNNLYKGALLLCISILNEQSPRQKWEIVNIAHTDNIDNRRFHYPALKVIPTIFGYQYDKVPQLLVEEGVIEAMVHNRWFIGVVPFVGAEVKEASLHNKDIITPIAWKKGYLTKKQRVAYYSDWDNNRGVLYGPEARGQYAILVNHSKLREFVYWYSGISPKFLLENGVGKLEFLDETVEIRGEIEAKSMELLIKYINSIVSKKEFYEVRPNTNFDTDVEKHGATKINEMGEKVFKALKDRLEKSKLNKVLIPVQKDGFGFFVNQRALLKTPQTKEENSPITA